MIEALTIMRTVIEGNTDVMSTLTGGVHLLNAGSANRPNIVLTNGGGNSGLSHSGSEGLSRSLVRLFIHCDSESSLGGLDAALRNHLHGFSEQSADHNVQLIKFNGAQSDFNDESNRSVMRAWHDYWLTFKES